MDEARLNEILVGAFVAVESMHSFSAVLPSIFTIRHFGHEPGAARAIRDGELVGTGMSIALGALVSVLIKSKLPLLFSIATSAAMVSVYEFALRTRYRREVEVVEMKPINGNIFEPAPALSAGALNVA